MDDAEPASCLYCQHWSVIEGCAMDASSHVQAFFEDPVRYTDADMSACPGFEEIDCEVEP
jgi:hypothetical protein